MKTANLADRLAASGYIVKQVDHGTVIKNSDGKELTVTDLQPVIKSNVMYVTPVLYDQLKKKLPGVSKK